MLRSHLVQYDRADAVVALGLLFVDGGDLVNNNNTNGSIALRIHSKPALRVHRHLDRAGDCRAPASPRSDLTADLANLPPVPASRTAQSGGPFAVLLFKEVISAYANLIQLPIIFTIWHAFRIHTAGHCIRPTRSACLVHSARASFLR
jgi:hypothetical protein